MDLHCDTISRIRSRRNEGHICGLQDNHFHVDLKRMKEAGYSLQTFALFTDAAGRRALSSLRWNFWISSARR